MAFFAGACAGWFVSAIIEFFKNKRRTTLKPVSEVVRRVGPQIYSKTTKKKPIAKTDFELWKQEQKSN